MKTVKELKELLSEFDDNMEVIISTGKVPWKPISGVKEDKLVTIRQSKECVVIE